MDRSRASVYENVVGQYRAEARPGNSCRPEYRKQAAGLLFCRRGLGRFSGKYENQ